MIKSTLPRNCPYEKKVLVSIGFSTFFANFQYFRAKKYWIQYLSILFFIRVLGLFKSTTSTNKFVFFPRILHIFLERQQKKRWTYSIQRQQTHETFGRQSGRKWRYTNGKFVSKRRSKK